MSKIYRSKNFRRDWFRILSDLAYAGVTLSDVARACGRHPSAVRNWRDGGEPKESDALVVLSMYAMYFPKLYEAQQLHYDIQTIVKQMSAEKQRRAFVASKNW